MSEKINNQLNAEIALTVAWLEDTLQPSLDILSLKSMVNEVLAVLELFENKNGISENTTSRKEMFNLMLEKIERLDKIAMQNNTFQLVVKHSDLKMIQLRQENQKLKQELEAAKKAWEQL